MSVGFGRCDCDDEYNGEIAGYAAGDGAEDSARVRTSCRPSFARGDKIAEADEEKLDTARIQNALDKCKPGMAVELKAAERQQCFFDGAAGVAQGRDTADR